MIDLGVLMVTRSTDIALINVDLGCQLLDLLVCVLVELFLELWDQWVILI